MLEFASNTEVEIEIPYEYNGSSLTLTGFEYELLDANSEVIQARIADENFNASTSSSVLTIPVASNTTTAKRDVRLLNCYLINAAGTFIVPQVYLLKGNQLNLTPLTDSFMTYSQAVLTRVGMAESQDYYDALTDELKAVALEESFTRLAKLKFKVGTTEILDIKSLTLSAFNALNADFHSDIRKAQIAEANAIVEASPVRDKIRAGIISETIGESSMFFRQAGVPVTRSGVSDDAEQYLKKWLWLDSASSMTWRLNRA
jgi:hypothetical protein